MNKNKRFLMDIARGKYSREQFVQKMKKLEDGHTPVMALHNVSEDTVTVGAGWGGSVVDEKEYSYSEWHKAKANIPSEALEGDEFSLITIHIVDSREDIQKLAKQKS